MSDIRTRPATKEYRDNFPKVFGAKKKRKPRRRRRKTLSPAEAARRFEKALSIDVPAILLSKAATSADIRRRLKETP